MQLRKVLLTGELLHYPSPSYAKAKVVVQVDAVPTAKAERKGSFNIEEPFTGALCLVESVALLGLLNVSVDVG